VRRNLREKRRAIERLEDRQRHVLARAQAVEARGGQATYDRAEASALEWVLELARADLAATDRKAS